jgi:hypothetical protein
MADRAKFLDFMDMIDGGGRGQMGSEFKGNGIFSEIANMIATPYGSEDPERRRRLQERRRARGLLDMDAIGTKEEQAAAASRAAATPSVVKRSVPAAPMLSGGPTTRGGQRGPRVAPAGPPMPATAMSPVMPNQPMSTYDQVMPQANPMAGLGMGPATRGGRRGGASSQAPAIPAGMVAPTAGVAPNVNSKYDPMVVPSTRNPSAYRPINLSFPEFAPNMSTQPTSQSGPAPSSTQPTSVSDLPYADQIVAARQAIMREQITPDMLQSVFGVDFAREVMSGIQMMGGKTAVPNIPLGPLSIQRLHQTMPITRFD